MVGQAQKVETVLRSVMKVLMEKMVNMNLLWNIKEVLSSIMISSTCKLLSSLLSLTKRTMWWSLERKPM